MLFPDHRSRVEVPAFSDEQRAELKRKLYKPAFVELEKRPELSFAFMRPPGWEVGPPVLAAGEAFAAPPLATIRRRNPDAGLQVCLFEATYDCLPGDFLDSVLDGLSFTHVSEGRVGPGWYADRSVTKEHGGELLAAHRRGKDLYVFICAIRADGGAKVRDELLTILGTFSLKDEPAGTLADKWRMHEAEGVGFAVPDGATVATRGGVTVSWPVDGGPVVLGVRKVPAKEKDLAAVEKTYRTELARKGITLDEGKGHDIEAAPGGVLAGKVNVRSFQSTASSRHPAEVTLVTGTRSDGDRLRFTLETPARTTHKIAWMRGRFALVQLLNSLTAKET